MSTLVSLKPFTVGFKTKAAGARTDLALGLCHAQYAILSERNSKVPPRIEPHIETLLQGGYHYIIPLLSDSGLRKTLKIQTPGRDKDLSHYTST